MNSGGEPERDDTGLPPVDIEIPDDARELDRDVQAYRRELRAERRRLRHGRLHRKIARDGIVMPLVACCLILALITGTLLTVFTATSDQNPTRLHGYPPTATSRPPASSPATSGAAPSGAATSGAASRGQSTSPASSPGSRAGPTGSTSALNPAVTQKPLPPGTLTLAGQPVQLQSLHQTLLVLVPPACGCDATVSWLASIGAMHAAATYLVGTPQTIIEASQLRSRLPESLRSTVRVALDRQSVLADAYPVSRLTAVMVAGRSSANQAAYAKNLSAADHSEPLIRALAG